MVDGLLAEIDFEVHLRSTGHGVRAIDQHVMPELAAVGVWVRLLLYQGSSTRQFRSKSTTTPRYR